MSDVHSISSRALDAYRPIRRRVLGFTTRYFRDWFARHADRVAEWPVWPEGTIYFDGWQPGLSTTPPPLGDTQQPPDLDAIVVRAMSDFPAIQNPGELRAWLELVQAKRPRVVVEIGSGAGGVLYALAQLADREATLVSIDLAGGGYGGGHDDALAPVLRCFAGPQQQMALIRDRSFHYSTRIDLERILDGRKIDLLFIDGDHSYGGVRADFEMYAPLCAPDALIALHDITVTPENSGRGFDVGIFWKELAASRKTRTFIDGDGVPGLLTQRQAPPALVRPMAFGIGVLVP